MAKAFSIEDGNLQNISLTSSREKTYRDIDLSFAKKPSGEIYKKTDAAAVKQAVKNLLLTNKFEKPFKPNYGGDINRFLFSLGEDFDEGEVAEVIAMAISNYEPRALIRSVDVDYDDESYTMNITVLFKVTSTLEDVRVDVTLTRTR